MPDDKKPKPKQPSRADRIKSVLGDAYKAYVGVTPAGLVSRYSLNKMSENLEPFNYSDNATGKSTVDRFVDAVLLNKKEPSRAETEQYIQKGYGQIPTPTFKERIDLLQMVAGKPQKYNTIQESKYTPTYGAEKKKYYSAKGVEEEIIKELGLENLSKSDKSSLEKILKDRFGEKIGKYNNKYYEAIIPGLGQASYSVGSDERGPYVAYSDLWDLDPTSGAYADVIKASDFTTIEGIKNFLQNIGKKAATSVVNIKATPPDVYGRIYFDPKTGKLVK